MPIFAIFDRFFPKNASKIQLFRCFHVLGQKSHSIGPFASPSPNFSALFPLLA
jgi:hypothetical protein